MRISELSTRSGVTLPSIKFYLREELLAPGERTSPNQAEYTDAHLARLQLIRALIEVGGLSVSGVRDVLAAIDNTGMPLDWAFGVAQRALPHPITARASSDEVSRGTEEVDALLADAGWEVSAGNPGRALAARTIDGYEQLGQERLIAVLPEYLRAAEIVATADLQAVAEAPSREAMVEIVVVGTVMGDSLLAGLRRIAQERVSDLMFPTPPGIQPADCEEQ